MDANEDGRAQAREIAIRTAAYALLGTAREVRKWDVCTAGQLPRVAAVVQELDAAWEELLRVFPEAFPPAAAGLTRGEPGTGGIE